MTARRFPIILFLAVLVLGALSYPARAVACSCAGESSPKTELRRCDAVFTGRPVRERIITVQDPDTGERRQRMREFTFQVDSVLKGELSRRAAVITRMNSAACGYRFDVGAPYIVYARRAQHRLHTTICDRTKPLRQAKLDLKALGTGTPPK